MWTVNAILCIVGSILFPYAQGAYGTAIIYLAGTPIFAGLLAAWTLNLRASTLGLLLALARCSVAAHVVWVMSVPFLDDFENPIWLFAPVVYLLTTIPLIWSVYGRRCSATRRLAAIALIIAAHGLAIALPMGDGPLWRVATAVQTGRSWASLDDGQSEPPAPIEADLLWEAQSDRIAAAIAKLTVPENATTNVYGLAVAPLGTQNLFSREAGVALAALSSRFRTQYRGGVLLSNHPNDYQQAPLATRKNVASIASAIAQKYDPERDLLIVYLTSHGGSDASLESGLLITDP